MKSIPKRIEPSVSDQIGVSAVTEEIRRRKQTLYRFVKAGLFEATTFMRLPGSRLSVGGDPKYLWDYFELRGLEGAGSRSPRRELRIVDLFCGCGAFALGLSRAAKAVGLRPRILLAADVDRDAIGVYSQNLSPERVLVENLWSLVEFQLRRDGSRAEFLREPLLLHPAFRALRGNVDIIIGGPPCEGHSNFNNSTRRNDPRNLLYLVPLAVAAATGARLVIIENVPGVIHDRYAQVAGLAKQLAVGLGYAVDDFCLGALDIGVPQSRRRHILICSRGGDPNIVGVLNALRTQPRSIDFAIRDLTKFINKGVYNEAAVLSKENQKRIDYLFKNRLYELPDKVRPHCHRNGTSYVSVYGRLKWTLHSGTITTGFMSPGRGRFTHPDQRRALTPHEAARLQGIPDNFRFEISNPKGVKKALSKLIGDAVPPQMGYVAGIAALATLAP